MISSAIADHRAESAPDFQSRHRIFLLQNHPLMVLGTSSFLNRLPELEVCGSALTPDEALQALSDPLPDLVIFELSINGPYDFQTLEKLRKRFPTLPILAYSYHEEIIFARRALEAGASGYLMKEAEPDNLAAAVRCVLAGEQYLTDRVKARLAEENRGDRSLNGALVNCLSNRELQIFQYLGEGLSNESIAEIMGTTAQSVTGAQYRMRKKMGLQKSSELTLCALHWAYYEGDFS